MQVSTNVQLSAASVDMEDDFPIVGVDDLVTVDLSMDPLAGGTANGKPIWTADQIAAHLNRTGGQYGDGPNDLLQRGGDVNIIAFGFHENQDDLYYNGYVYTHPVDGNLYGFSEYFNFAPFTEAQRAATRDAIGYWDDVIAVDFVETDADHGDINFGNLASAPATQAYSRIPTAAYGPGGVNANFYGEQIAGLAGDVWISASQASNFQLDEGLYGLNTLTHEIGHSLGLSHPGNYNFGPGFAVTYANGAEYAQDARNYSIMSYWNPRDLGSTSTGVVTRDFDWSLMSIAYGATPMVHDILAAQNMYGAEMNTRTGDTTYGFNSNAGREAFDFEATPWPTMAIWDAGGIDTLDASGYNVNQRIDLTPGSLSSIGGMTYAEALEHLSFAQVNANRAAVGYGPISQATYDANMAAFAAQPDFRGRLTDNVGIAYGATIENAVGGGGNDVIIGNAANNTLTGNAGDDILVGGLGKDELIGGAGNDIFVFAETDAADKIRDFDSGADVIDLSAFGIGAGDVKITGGNVFANTDGAKGYDLHIVVQGDSVLMSDIFFG